MQWITVQDLDTPSSPYAGEAVQAASYILWQLSGRKFSGVQTITEIYRQTSLSSIATTPVSVSGGMTNRPCTSCGGTHTLWLRNRPVSGIVQMKSGETEIDPGTYLLLDGNRLIPSSPYACWGHGDITITYTHGIEVPSAGKLAARELANQIIYAVTGSDQCRLPDRVTSISRQGVSWTIIDPQDFLDQGRTGLYLVDLFIKTVNPTGARVRSRVFSPDTRRPGKVARPEASVRAGQITVTANTGEPFTVPLGYSTEAHIIVQITAHGGYSWEIPQRMLVRHPTTGVWSITGTLPGDTALVPNKALLDVYAVDGTAITYTATKTISRTGLVSQGDNYIDAFSDTY
jgi:hypothetical protein